MSKPSRKVILLGIAMLCFLSVTANLTAQEQENPELPVSESDNKENNTNKEETANTNGSETGEAAENPANTESTSAEGATETNPDIQEKSGFEDDYDDNAEFLNDPAEQSAKLEISDPLEFINRPIHKFNDFFIRYAFRPFAVAYGFIIPKPLRLGIVNFAENIHMPVKVVNSSLQGKFAGAGRELGRFGINTTLGLGGLFDPAKNWFEIAPSRESFDETLGIWGFGPGIYLNLPFLGPSNVRGLTGFTTDLFFKPEPYILNYAVFPGEPGYAFLGSVGVYTFFWTNEFSLNPNQYHELVDGAIDDYTLLRDVYYQYQRRRVEE